ncbi:Sugar transferase involved in LPS biosynthesis (colanic, teichoic acid) [Peptostreptococcaceae bacterium pGA-8]|nr:Sugar transferase involved in LPS biosynthesis (colanic, teichoic acid) [Peptostreptococcaceae bacterium pGA-8]
MRIVKWDNLPENMKNDDVRDYYNFISKKHISLVLKRCFDVLMAAFMIILLSPLLFIISILIKIDSPGPILYRQERVTQYGKVFRVCKFRTMVNNADKIGAHVTSDGDSRITKIGRKIRNSRIDELPQLFNIMAGTMSFVGTRPEAIRYVECYSPDMYATLLLPAGVTSEASIKFKDEAKLLTNSENIDGDYIEKVLPKKMEYNLSYLKEFSLIRDLKLMLETVLIVFR